MHNRSMGMAALVVLAGGMGAANAQAGAAPLVAHGIATTVSGKPLARATLYFPKNDGTAEMSAKTMVVTDDRGRFVWTTSAPFARYAQAGQTGPQCEAFPDDMGSWRIVPMISSESNPMNAIYQISGREARDCVTKWITVGDAPSFSVVAPDTANVTMVLRGPDGLALANHSVELASNPRLSDENILARYGVTDSQGRLTLRWYPGLTHLQFVAPGTGFGSTGYFDVAAGKDILLQTPPLARVATVSGTVAPALNIPGVRMTISPSGFSGFSWYRPIAQIDAQGRFELKDVLAGSQYLFTISGASRQNGVSVNVNPGEDVTDMNIRPQVYFTPPGSKLPAPAATETATAIHRSVHGRVTDSAGRPVAGVKVYANCTYSVDYNTGEGVTRAGTTDADGAFEITNLPTAPTGVSVWLFATPAGRPSAFASVVPDDSPRPAGTPPDKFHGDLILPDGRSGLVVRVMSQGKALPGASVRISPHGTGMRSQFPQIRNGVVDNSASLEKLDPMAVTNADGEARFENLKPGLWDISATAGEYQPAHGGASTLVTGSGNSAAVGGDEVRTFTLNVHARPVSPVIRVLDAEGKLQTNTGVQVLSGLANGGLGMFSSLAADANGDVATMDYEPGLKRVSPRYRDVNADGVSITVEPIYEGDGYLALSPAVSFAPATFRTMRHESGRLQVHLENASGLAAAGASVVLRDPLGRDQWASVDPNGEAVFSDLPSGEYTIQALDASPTSHPKLGADGDALPIDFQLKNVQLFTPCTTTIKSGEETHETMRAERQGYIRGTIAGLNDPRLYQVYINDYYASQGLFQINRATGEFLAGPFPSGTVKLQGRRLNPDGSESYGALQEWPVQVKGGGVVHVTLHTDHPARIVEPERAPAPLSSQVFLADGVTPAWGAKVAILSSNKNMSMSHWDVGADGRLTPATTWFSNAPQSNPIKDSMTAPVIVAWLPGTSGAAIVPYVAGETKHIVLPAPNVLHGRVTVGGKPTDGVPSSFRVMATSEGHGQLDSLLGVDLTTQDNGEFDLRGLTPGTYRIQAARDGVWLSETKTVVVGKDPLPDMNFDIGPIGAAMILHLTDTHGKPLANQTVTIAHPTGPLTDILWPKTFTTDAAGDLRLEGLEAGSHEIRVGGERKGIAFSTPAFEPGGAACEATVKE